ncbi:MAG: ABC transporter substrate-binding protein [Phycisphaerae bacterium]
MNSHHRTWAAHKLAAAVCIAAATAVLAASGCSSKNSAAPAGPHPRIVSFSPALTDMLFDLGLGDHVVGVTTQCNLPAGATKPRVGDRFSVNAESIAAVEPDIVLIQQDPNDFAALRKIKPAVRIEHFTIETLADIGSAVERIGALAGRQTVGKAAKAKFQGELEAVRKRVAGLARPKVLFLVLYEPDKPATGGKSSFVHEMIELAGGVDTAAKYERWSDLNAEAVLAMAPDVLVCWTDPAHQNAAQNYWQSLKGLPAARNGRVFVVTDPNWTIPSMKTAELAGYLTWMIHPELAGEKSASQGAGRD